MRRLLIIAMLVVLAAILLVYLIPGARNEGGEREGGRIIVKEVGRAGDFGFVVYFANASGNITLLSYESQPLRKIGILKESSIDPGKEAELFSRLKELEKYGFSLSSVGRRDYEKLKDSVIIVASGAMPSYVLHDLNESITERRNAIIYIGSSELILSGTLKKRAWLDDVPHEVRQDVVVYNESIGDFIDSWNSRNLTTLLLENGWKVKGKKEIMVNSEGVDSTTLLMKNASYLRVIYQSPDATGIVDSGALPKPKVEMEAKNDIFPWERSYISFFLNRTNGSIVMEIRHNGAVVTKKELGFIGEEKGFYFPLSFNESGDYLIFVSDRNGVITSNRIHVKNATVALKEKRGYDYVFSVSVDGIAVDGEPVVVGLKNSTKTLNLYVSGGELAVPAKLQKGMNVFTIRLYGREFEVEVENKQESIVDVYVKYGIPALLLIAATYLFVIVSKRPIYRIRMAEAAVERREEIRIGYDDMLRAMTYAQKTFGDIPLSVREIMIGIKEEITNGRDAAEGNVEAILKVMEAKGLVESYKGYYQRKNGGDVRKNYLQRMIAEKLMENGVQFSYVDGKFETGNFEIGLPDARFTRYAIMIFEDEKERSDYIAGLPESERAKLLIRKKNDTLRLVILAELHENM